MDRGAIYKLEGSKGEARKMEVARFSFVVRILDFSCVARNYRLSRNIPFLFAFFVAFFHFRMYVAVRVRKTAPPFTLERRRRRKKTDVSSKGKDSGGRR